MVTIDEYVAIPGNSGAVDTTGYQPLPHIRNPMKLVVFGYDEFPHSSPAIFIKVLVTVHGTHGSPACGSHEKRKKEAKLSTGGFDGDFVGCQCSLECVVFTHNTIL